MNTKLRAEVKNDFEKDFVQRLEKLWKMLESTEKLSL